MNVCRTFQALPKVLLLSVIFICFFLTVTAQSNSDCFVRIYPDKETIYEGDSLLVSVVLHSIYPIHQAEETCHFKYKGNGTVRPLCIHKDNAAGQTRIDKKLYYTLVWEQYMIAPKHSGNFEFFSPQFKAILREITDMPSWIDQMMGAEPKYKDHSVKAKSTSYKFKVKEKPLRTTEEMMKYQIVI